MIMAKLFQSASECLRLLKQALSQSRIG